VLQGDRNGTGAVTAISRASVGLHGIQCSEAPAVTSAYGPPRPAVSAAPTIQRRLCLRPPVLPRTASTIAADESTASTWSTRDASRRASAPSPAPISSTVRGRR
jgi:hypothetical protein